MQQPSNEPDQTMDPGLKSALDKLLVTIQNKPGSPEPNGSDEFKNEILKKVQPTEEQFVMAFIPHQMAKISIFFPMSRRELEDKNRKISRVEHKTSWGKVAVEGIKLSITEEDIFLAIMMIVKKNPNKVTAIKGLPTLQCNMKEIARRLYGRQGYTEQSYCRILKALDHFALVRFEIATGTWRKKGKEKFIREQKYSIGNIVTAHKYNDKTGSLLIHFNPIFLDYFGQSMLTNINFTLRRQLKKDGSKAALRFLSTHNKPSQMHIKTFSIIGQSILYNRAEHSL